MEIARTSKRSYTNKLAAGMGEELTTEELTDLRVILVRFMADKETHSNAGFIPS